MSVELKPCPLCGHDAAYQQVPQVRSPWSHAGCNSYAYTVVCTFCGCTIPSYLDRRKARDVWNARACEDRA